MTTKSSSAKRALGSGFQLVILPAGGPYELRLDAPFEHPEWIRRQETVGRATYPGTALLVDGRWYEILSVEDASGVSRRVSYGLAPWEDRFPLRKVYELTPEYLKRFVEVEREKRHRMREAGVLRFLPLLLGLLPAEDQEALERNYGLSGNRNSLLSAVVLLATSIFVVMVIFAYSQGMSFGPWAPLVDGLAPWLPVAMYLFVESVVRLAYTMQSRDPIGSMPVAGPLLAARMVVQAFSKDAQRRAAIARELGATPRQMESVRDEVRRLEDGRLEVLSRLPKKHWTIHMTGLQYRNQLYYPESREVVQTPEGMRHRFVLAVPDREILWKEILPYRPEEVREIYREERRLSIAMWVETFALLWGFLDQGTQVRIERGFNYEPWNKTRWSLAFATAIGIWWLLLGITSFGGGEADLLDGFLFLAALYLLWETAVRRKGLAEGEIRGSVLGWFLKPLVVPALKWGPKPLRVAPAEVYRGDEGGAGDRAVEGGDAVGGSEREMPDIYPG